MAVRNFWFEADVDGYKTKPAGGPRNKDGGMTVMIKQRDEGSIVDALMIECWADNGRLVTNVFHDGEKRNRHDTSGS